MLMKQMIVDPESKANIDFTKPETERTLKILQPVVYKDGDAFCCILRAKIRHKVYSVVETQLAKQSTTRNKA